jgi:hypothetical protein
MVEQSMNSRDCSDGAGGSEDARMVSKTDLTCWGSGRTVMIVSYSLVSLVYWASDSFHGRIERKSEDWL